MTPHLRQLVVAVTAVLALAVVCAVAWTPRPGAAARPTEPPPPPSTVPLAAEAESASPEPAIARNVFEFVDRVERPVAPAALPPVSVPPPLDPASSGQPEPSPVRLVGFVRRGGALRAALSLHGSVSVLAPGEEADGYAVLSVDEDVGVTVRSPDGSEIVLPPTLP